MSTVFFIVQIILGILLIALVVMQSKNLGLFNLTVLVSALFFLVAVASAMLF